MNADSALDHTPRDKSYTRHEQKEMRMSTIKHWGVHYWQRIMPHRPYGTSVAVTIITLVIGLLASSSAYATHTVITSSDREFSPIGNGNDHKVYLSSPRHSNSGNRGELGWEENINGRHWNYYAAAGNFKNGVRSYASTRNLRARGYHVKVSANSRDDGYMQNRTASNNWEAHVHLVTHTNAGQGNYMLIMVDDQTATASDRSLRSQLDIRLGDQVPGTEVLATDNSGYTNNINLAELSANAEYNVYVELVFHDNQTHVDWLGSGDDWGRSVKHHAWRYGYAIDVALGYP